MNYELEMQKQLNYLSGIKKLLIHACCAPCSSAVLEYLTNYFEITILFYNPNITEIDEYKKRLKELKEYIEKINYKNKITLIEGKYEPNKFFAISKNLEKEPEKGKRCYSCYKLRMKEAAKYAKENNYDYFTTVLTISPLKNATWVNEIGEQLSKEYSINYLYSDFKKKERYKRTLELSNKYNLYRQDYCGCIYSKRT